MELRTFPPTTAASSFLGAASPPTGHHSGTGARSNPRRKRARRPWPLGLIREVYGLGMTTGRDRGAPADGVTTRASPVWQRWAGCKVDPTGSIIEHMSDLPSDLPRLRTLRMWHAMWVERIDTAITAAEQREAERQQGEARRPPPPDWVLQLGIGVGSPPIEVHAGHCYAIGKRHRPITREQALAALAEGVPGCIHCRPDTELGVL